MDLTGQWSGSYVYPGELDPVPFNAAIRDHDGRLSGLVDEPGGAWSTIDVAHAVLTGERRGRDVSFTKVYDAIEAFPDPVAYDGTLDEDGCEIVGEWHIGPSWSGSFVMTRPKQVAAEIEAEEVAET